MNIFVFLCSLIWMCTISPELFLLLLIIIIVSLLLRYLPSIKHYVNTLDSDTSSIISIFGISRHGYYELAAQLVNLRSGYA